LLVDGVLTADTTAPPKSALVIKAKETGLAGNNLQVKFANVLVDPGDVTKSTFDVTVSETDSYPLLSLVATDAAYVGTVLGTGTTAGTKPGLVTLNSLGASTKIPLAAANYMLEPTTGNTVDLNDAASASRLKLEPRKTVSAGVSKIVIQVTPGSDPDTFGMTVSLAVSNNVMLAKLLTVTDFKDFVKFDSPDGSALSAVPAAGTVQLTGGTPAATPQAASATVVAGA
jgi:hypothetical protein